MRIDGSDVAGYLSAEDVRMKMRMSSGFLKFQKWLVIYNLLVDPRPLAEIARHTGLSESSVHRIVAEYNHGGPESIDTLGEIRKKPWFECAGVSSI
ncbi:MAG: helix-turn-helix domain-containing protein [Syntrophobacteraceae bacterium]